MIKVQTHKSAVSEFWFQHIFQRKSHDVVEVLHLKHEKDEQLHSNKNVLNYSTDGSYHL